MTNPNTQVDIVRPEKSDTLLAHYGSRKEIREMVERLRRSTLLIKLKAGETRKMTETECMTLAMACLPYGFQPGVDIVPMQDRSGNFTLHYAPSCWQKAAQVRLREEGGGNYWPQYEMITSPDERELLLVPQGAIVVRCKLYDTPTIRAYTDLVGALNQVQGMTAEKLEQYAGSRPYTEGIGWYVPSGNTKFQDEAYPPIERAKKRALKQALKARFSLEFQDNESDGFLPDEFSGALAKPDKPIDVPLSAQAQDYTDPAFVDAQLRREQNTALWGE